MTTQQPYLHHPVACRLWAQSDVRALHALHLHHPDVVTADEWSQIAEYHRLHINGPDVYATAPSHTWGTRTMDDARHELEAQLSCPRWGIVEEILEAIPAPRVRRAMDFGSWVGAHAIAMANLYPEAVVFARDIVPDIVPIAQELCREQGTPNVVVQTGDYRDLPKNLDLVFGGEVLEHIWEWKTVIAAIEQACRPEAPIILTMPIGAWEDGQPERLHLMEWTTEACAEVFGAKAGFLVTTLAATTAAGMLGWNIVEFKAQTGPTGEVDYAARFRAWGLEVNR